MKTVCPQCKAEYGIGPEHVGTQMACSKCGVFFVIVAAPEATVPGAPPPWGQSGAFAGSPPAWGQQGWAPPRSGLFTGMFREASAANVVGLLVFGMALVAIYLVSGIVCLVNILNQPVFTRASAILFVLTVFATAVYFIVASLYANICLAKIAGGGKRGQ
jgi:hypothetical protein